MLWSEKSTFVEVKNDRKRREIFVSPAHIKHSGKDVFCRGTLRLKRTQKH